MGLINRNIVRKEINIPEVLDSMQTKVECAMNELKFGLEKVDEVEPIVI